MKEKNENIELISSLNSEDLKMVIELMKTMINNRSSCD